MPAILFTNAMIMEPAKLMDLASVILDSSTMTVLVNISYAIYDWGWYLQFGALLGFLVLLTKALTNVSKNIFQINFPCTQLLFSQ